MSMPGNALSSQAVSSDLLYPDDLTREPLIDYELGGIAIADASEGLQYQVWTLTYDDGTGDVICTPTDVGPPVTLFSIYNITELSLAFDQNMNVFVAYVVDDSQAWYYWYDPIAAEYVHQIMEAGVTNPRCTMDDKRPVNVNNSDIILAYTRNNALWHRRQRDRYETEYLLRTGPIGRFDKVAMGRNSRLHFEFLTSPSEVVIPSPLNKLQVLENASEQGYLDLGAWSLIAFATKFAPDTVLGPNFTSTDPHTALEYITYPTGGGGLYGLRIKDDGQCNRAELLQVNYTNGLISGGAGFYGGPGDSSVLPFYNGATNCIVVASDTGNVTLEKVNYP